MSEETPIWNLAWFLDFLIIATILAVVGAFIKLVFPKKDRVKERNASMDLAKRICENRQRVCKIAEYPPPGMLAIQLRADTDTMDEFYLLFPQNHPNFESLRQLTRVSIVAFEFCADAVAGSEQDAIAYLRLKD